jgi:hypothetical protein
VNAIHGKATGLVVGEHELTRLFRDISTASTTDVADATMFQSPGNAKEYVAGMSDGTVSAKGKFVGSSTAAQEVLEDAQGADSGQPLLVVYGGWTPGNRVRCASVRSIAFEVSSSIADIVSTSANFQCDGGLRPGVLLSGAAALSASTNGATVDGGAASPEGGTAQLHVVSNSRNAAVNVTLQHSTNGTVWVDLLEDWAALAAGESISDVALLTDEVFRYTRIVTTLAAGTGTVAVIASLTRNGN